MLQQELFFGLTYTLFKVSDNLELLLILFSLFFNYSHIILAICLNNSFMFESDLAEVDIKKYPYFLANSKASSSLTSNFSFKSNLLPTIITGMWSSAYFEISFWYDSKFSNDFFEV